MPRRFGWGWFFVLDVAGRVGRGRGCLMRLVEGRWLRRLGLWFIRDDFCRCVGLALSPNLACVSALPTLPGHLGSVSDASEEAF
ncbi:hypothetical protein BDY21DRAFT_153788 [Lineolata rhizophorae]|uniref:Uncharacterized protein n=1 Tax=Lineolata rhizophorae TaxID=578093 RepID=A0A6A6NMS2_9PEZI|nr:hypothetical protein BDY21DRAFT_153788 [Lineolata rhizophorae]